MKTIDEIVLGLRCCEGGHCDVKRCPYSELEPNVCFVELRKDAREALERVQTEVAAEIAEEARLREELEGVKASDREEYPADDGEVD